MRGAQQPLSKTLRTTCEDCYFRQTGLCALLVDEPCPTFRNAVRGPLVRPLQARLVPRPSDPLAEHPSA